MRMPRYQEMRPNTSAYVVFYCESCNPSINSSPDVGGAIGNQLKNSLLRQISGLMPGAKFCKCAGAAATA